MKDIIENQIGMLIACFISLIYLEPSQSFGFFLLVNVGYWLGYYTNRSKKIKP